MKLLLDSHVYLWWVLADHRLSTATTRAIATAEEAWLSFVTPWELELKAAAGKLALPRRIWSEFGADRFELLTATLDDSLVAARLPMHHKDPFDRMLVAQALRRGLTVVTSDRNLALYGVPVLRA